MQWGDEAIVVAARPFGETAVVAEVFTREHGRIAGMVHGGRSRRLRPLLQPGNHVDVRWRARLDEQLGSLTLEPRKLHAADVLDQPRALLALLAMTGLLRLLAEREPHPRLYEVALFVLAFIDDPKAWPPVYARFELALLDELGFGLDLAACAVSGATQDLAYVSPRTGRAVSRREGEPYAAKLLRLPPFLAGGLVDQLSDADIADALALSGHFLSARVLTPHDLAMPSARQRLAAQFAAPPATMKSSRWRGGAGRGTPRWRRERRWRRG